MTELPILYQDEHYVAIDKPAGLLVHRTRIAEGQVFAMQMLRDQLGQWVYPVHRLDRPTSGVLLFGLSQDAARNMSGLFEHRQVKKQYVAIVRGYVDDSGVIDYPLAEEPGRPTKSAVTAYRCLDRTELPIAVTRYPTSRYSLVSIQPETGRMHQIRKHFAHIRHPLIGDTTHGEGRHNRFFREHFGVDRLLLMASALSFVHPFTDAPVLIQAPPDTAWLGLCRKLGVQSAY